MFTYESFVTNGAFTLLRPITITLMIVSAIIFLLIILPKTRNRVVNGFSVISSSLILSIISIQIMFSIGILADELNLAGDPTSFILCVIIFIFSFINVILHFWRSGVFTKSPFKFKENV
ncbi:hypothetical protein [Virgibacillus sp. 6R]|uniref:hypothetical protein n=1 Tax=Metabacillus sp. 22489 TaxID=3453928 RepID=UPI0011AA1312